jgi:hypothetical protein
MNRDCSTWFSLLDLLSSHSALLPGEGIAKAGCGCFKWAFGINENNFFALYLPLMVRQAARHFKFGT